MILISSLNSLNILELDENTHKIHLQCLVLLMDVS